MPHFLVRNFSYSNSSISRFSWGTTTRNQNHPYYLDEGGKIWKRLTYFVGPVIIFSIIYCLPEYFETYVCEHITKHNVTKIFVVSNFRLDKYYVIIYKNVLNNLVTGLIPIFSLASLNYAIYKHLIQRRIEIATGMLDIQWSRRFGGLFLFCLPIFTYSIFPPLKPL